MSASKIVYKYIESPLGTLIIGATSKGCCLLEFKDNHTLVEIRSRLRKYYRLDMVNGTNSIVEKLETELNEYFRGSLQKFTIPLDLRGTDFEINVWKELQRIPYGETRSYMEVARLIKNPSAIRAVGRANGKNQVAIVVPCHRVIGKDGKLHGYNGGLWRKKKLLALEKRYKSKLA